MTKAARNVEFPTCCWTDGVLVYVPPVSRNLAGDGAQISIKALTFGGGRRAEVHRRQELRTSARSRSASLVDPRECSRKVQILIQSTLYDRDQHRIAEPGPPLLERRRCILCRWSIHAIVKGRQRWCWCFVSGAYRATCQKEAARQAGQTCFRENTIRVGHACLLPSLRTIV